MSVVSLFKNVVDGIPGEEVASVKEVSSVDTKSPLSKDEKIGDTINEEKMALAKDFFKKAMTDLDVAVNALPEVKPDNSTEAIALVIGAVGPVFFKGLEELSSNEDFKEFYEVAMNVTPETVNDIVGLIIQGASNHFGYEKTIKFSELMVAHTDQITKTLTECIETMKKLSNEPVKTAGNQ